MSKRTDIKIKLINATLGLQSGKCPICNRAFKKITENSCVAIEAHHQTTKTQTISKACNSSYKSALVEFINGSCVWVHSDCHAIMHKITKTGDTSKKYQPIEIDKIDYGTIKQINEEIENLR